MSMRRRTGILMSLAAIGAIAMLAAPSALAKKKASGKVRTGTATTTIAPGTAGSAIATCPPGRAAVGGGYASTTPQIVVPPQRLAAIYESRRLSRVEWVVSARNLGSGAGTVDLTASVYCRKGKVSQAVTATPIGTAGRSEAAAVASCPRRSHAVSGGFHVPPFAAGGFVFVTANSLVEKRRWGVNGVRSASAGPAGEAVTAFVYCQKGKRGARSRSSSTTATSAMADVVPTTTTPSCKKPAKPLGGGFLAPYADSGLIRETVLVTEAQRLGRAWRTSGFVFGSSGLTHTLTALGYCS